MSKPATSLIRRYHLTRLMIAAVILVVSGMLVFTRDWWVGLAIVGMALAVIFDARMRYLGRWSQSPWFPLFVDSTAVGIATIFGQLPAEAVIPPFSYMVVCAFALLSIRAAAWFLLYPVAWLVAYLLVVDFSGWSGIDLWIVRAAGLLTFLPGMVAILITAAGVMKSAEQLDLRLAASRRQLHAAVTGAPLVLFEYDSRGIFTLSEGAGLAKLGVVPGEVVGLSVREVYAEAPEVLAGVERSLKGESFSEVVPLGELFFQVQYSAHHSDRGDVERVVGVATDISDRVAAEAALEDQIRSKDEFVATIAHELRTPLTAVVGISEELRSSQQLFNLTETQEFIGMIADQSHEVAAIVEDLLVAARADLGKVTVVCQEIDLLRTIEGVLAETNHLQNSSTHSISVGGTAGSAVADPQRVRQILRNLVTNALRYGGEKVWIDVKGNGDWTKIVVADNGPGIPDSERDSVFMPFRRAHNTPGMPGSLGLGLSVSRKLAEMMDGTLTYRKTGTRAEFELSLPSGTVE